VKKVALDYALRVRTPITIVVVLIAFAMTYFFSRAERDGVGYTPDQPINYSHKLHAGELGIDCQYCHTGADKSRHAMIPATETCMNCHNHAATDRKEIIKLKEYYDSGEPIPWNRVHQVPDYAYFNHSVHVNSGINCISCHGDVKNMDKISQEHSFTMSACLDCHRQAQERLSYIVEKKVKKGPENCNACHR